ncbi:MAG: hypothetical protein AAF497_22805 [Planctomycetota bacterium]
MKSLRNISLVTFFTLLLTTPAYCQLAVDPISIEELWSGLGSERQINLDTGEIVVTSRDIAPDTLTRWTFDFGKPISLVGFTNDVTSEQNETLTFFNDLSNEPLELIEIERTPDGSVAAFEPIVAQYVVWEASSVYLDVGDPEETGIGLIQNQMIGDPVQTIGLQFFAVPEPSTFALLAIATCVSLLCTRNR